VCDSCPFALPKLTACVRGGYARNASSDRVTGWCTAPLTTTAPAGTGVVGAAPVDVVAAVVAAVVEEGTAAGPADDEHPATPTAATRRTAETALLRTCNMRNSVRQWLRVSDGQVCAAADQRRIRSRVLCSSADGHRAHTAVGCFLPASLG